MKAICKEAKYLIFSVRKIVFAEVLSFAVRSIDSLIELKGNINYFNIYSHFKLKKIKKYIIRKLLKIDFKTINFKEIS